jgi:hypothetical protein
MLKTKSGRLFRMFGRPEEIFGMHEVEYYKKIDSDFPKIGFGFYTKYGQFSPKENPTFNSRRFLLQTK